jgi:hypothetical protein
LQFYLLYQQEDVWNFINSRHFDVANNLLFCFVKTNIALNYRKAETAIQTIRYAQTLPEYAQMPAMDYELGAALLYKTDTNAAFYLLRFLRNNIGQLFTKDALQKLAYFYYGIKPDMAKADYYRRQIPNQGNKLVDADKQASAFFFTNKWPNKTLLQAALLIDGGYYHQALACIGFLKEADFHSLPDKLEYNFRLGRIYEELHDDNQSLHYYQAAVDWGQNRSEYFAARAALQMGFIYERHGQNREAINRFKTCLSMRKHDFQLSIDQQAKAGINRLSVE